MADAVSQFVRRPNTKRTGPVYAGIDDAEPLSLRLANLMSWVTKS